MRVITPSRLAALIIAIRQTQARAAAQDAGR